MEDIRNIESIKGSIETVLEIIRDVYKADICALFLIMKEMHEDERLKIFEERLISVEEVYKKKGEQMPQKLQEYCNKYDGNRENLRQFLSEVDILKFSFREAQSPKPSIQDPNPNVLPGRLWKYNYKNRPSKWVIFKEYSEKHRDKSIIFEGLTAHAVRTGTELFISNPTEMEKYPCVTHLNARAGITPECKMVIFFILKDDFQKTDQVIGLVKIENYSEIKDAKDWFSEDSAQTEEARKYLSILTKLIKKSEQFYDEYSYEKLYRGIQLLNLLKKFTPTEGTLNQKIYDLTCHLFWVLYRKEYVGYEEIMTRVTNYADDLADELDISQKEFFKKLLERRRQYEDLMLYKTEGYRDHFMHQFHVFVTGYLILNYIGLNKICDCVNNSLENRPFRPKLREESILRIWFLTSLMHDAAYVFERFGEGTVNFLGEEWGYPFTVEPSGLQLLGKEKPFGRYLANMLSFFKCKESTNQEDVLTCYLDSIVKLSDHGVLSALLAIEKFSSGMQELRIIECYLSALAMSFHNPNIFKNLKEGRVSGISFESFPIPFMLAFCDTLCIWGRTREIQQDVHPELLDIEFNDKKKEITVKLFYKTPFPGKIPTSQVIRKWLVQDKDVFFRSSTFKFMIEFYGGKEWSGDLNLLNLIDTVPFKYSGS